MSLFDVEQIRKDFPALSQKIYKDKPLVYFDNAATTQKPQAVIDAIVEAYTTRNANIHRGVHLLSREATEAHEKARKYVADFINASSSDEILFTRGTTESINLVAATFCRRFMIEGDEVIVTTMEHHSNIVPWQMQQKNLGIKLKVVPISDSGMLDMEQFEKAFSKRTKLVSVCHASNVLGTVNPIGEMAKVAHQHNVPILVDGAQAIAHMPVDVRQLDVDFYAFSSHKIYGPTGIGVLYGKREWLDKLPPYQGGGEMISSVTFEHTEYNELPYKFESGTPNFIGSVAMVEGIKYIRNIGFDAIRSHEQELLHYATERLQEIEGLRIYGTDSSKEAVVSFLIDGVHPYDLGMLIDHLGIAIRTGHHCAQPLMHRYGIEGTMRASFALYNTREEIDVMIEGIKKVLPMVK